jgi:hypothetical protein
VVEREFGSHHHPIWTLIAAGALMAAGLALPLIRMLWAACRRRIAAEP